MFHGAGAFAGGCRGHAIFLGVGSRAKAVLEVDAKIFDRFTFELGGDAPVDR